MEIPREKVMKLEARAMRTLRLHEREARTLSEFV